MVMFNVGSISKCSGLVVTMCNTYRVTKAHSKLCTLVRGGKR